MFLIKPLALKKFHAALASLQIRDGHEASLTRRNVPITQISRSTLHLHNIDQSQSTASSGGTTAVGDEAPFSDEVSFGDAAPFGDGASSGDTAAVDDAAPFW